MAIETIWNAKVTIDGVDVSDHVRSVDVPRKADELDVSAMGSRSKQRRQGMRDDQFVFNVYQDFAAQELHSILEPLFESGSSFTVVVRPDAAAPVGTTNPQFVGTCVLMEYDPLNIGAPNDVSMTQITCPTYSGHIREESTATYS